MRKDLGVVIAVLAAGLAFGGHAKASHETCEEVAVSGINFLKENGKAAVGEKKGYGDPGAVSPDDYDKCLVENFEKGAPGYTIKVIKNDPSYAGGTTYKIAERTPALKK